MVFGESEGPCQGSWMSLGIKGDSLAPCLKKKKLLDLAVMDWTPGKKKCVILSCMFCLRPEAQTSRSNSHPAN